MCEGLQELKRDVAQFLHRQGWKEELSQQGWAMS